MPELTSARLKLDRGREHTQAAEECVAEWLETNAFSIEETVDPETGMTVATARIAAAPPALLSLLVGDAVQNFRAALDHAVYELATAALGSLGPATQEELMFPVIGSADRKGKAIDGSARFASVADTRLQGLSAAAVEFIEQQQPYHYGEQFRGHPLWLLHDLSRIDKHRRVTLTTTWLDLLYVSHSQEDASGVHFHRADGPVEDSEVLVTYMGAAEGMSFHASRNVAITEPTSPHHATVEHSLNAVERHTEWVVGILERFL